MNRIMLIIEYMNAIYALEKLDNHFYPATAIPMVPKFKKENSA
jgi:hypothetical protein